LIEGIKTESKITSGVILVSWMVAIGLSKPLNTGELFYIWALIVTIAGVALMGYLSKNAGQSNE